MPAYNIKQIYVGNFVPFDTIESIGSSSDFDNEISSVDGFASGTIFNKNNMRIVDIIQNDTVNNDFQGSPRSDRLEEDDAKNYQNPIIADSYTYDLGSASITSKIDTTFLWNATVKWGDGTSVDIKISFVQLQNGDIFLTPGATFFDNRNIQSITLGSPDRSDFYGVSADQGIDNANIVCFAAGTMIKTAKGECKVENLSVGDQVLTIDMGLQPIRWIGFRDLNIQDLRRSPELYPIRICPHALGDNHPEHDLLVSPQHRVLIRNRVAHRMFNTNEVLLAAKHLCGLKGVEVADDVTDIRYYHILFDHHQIIWSNNAATESLYTGPEAVKALTKEQLTEIFTLFPALRNCNRPSPNIVHQTTLARLTIAGRPGRNMINRIEHSKHDIYASD